MEINKVIDLMFNFIVSSLNIGKKIRTNSDYQSIELLQCLTPPKKK